MLKAASLFSRLTITPSKRIHPFSRTLSKSLLAPNSDGHPTVSQGTNPQHYLINHPLQGHIQPHYISLSFCLLEQNIIPCIRTQLNCMRQNRWCSHTCTGGRRVHLVTIPL